MPLTIKQAVFLARLIKEAEDPLKYKADTIANVAAQKEQLRKELNAVQMLQSSLVETIRDSYTLIEFADKLRKELAKLDAVSQQLSHKHTELKYRYESLCSLCPCDVVTINEELMVLTCLVCEKSVPMFSDDGEISDNTRSYHQTVSNPEELQDWAEAFVVDASYILVRK